MVMECILGQVKTKKCLGMDNFGMEKKTEQDYYKIRPLINFSMYTFKDKKLN